MSKRKESECRECKCKDWKKNIDHLNAGTVLMAVHGGGGYAGKQIVFCPWCGKKLTKVKKPQSLNADEKNSIVASPFPTPRTYILPDNRIYENNDPNVTTS